MASNHMRQSVARQPHWKILVSFFASVRREWCREKVEDIIRDLTVENQVILMTYATLIFPGERTKQFTEVINILSSAGPITDTIHRLLLYESMKGLLELKTTRLLYALQHNDKADVLRIINELDDDDDEILNNFCDDDDGLNDFWHSPELVVKSDILTDDSKLRQHVNDAGGKIMSSQEYHLSPEHLVELCSVISEPQRQREEYKKRLQTVIDGVENLLQSFQEYIFIGLEGLSRYSHYYFHLWKRIKYGLPQFILSNRTPETVAMLIALQSSFASQEFVKALVKALATSTESPLTNETKKLFLTTVTYCASIGICQSDCISLLLKHLDWDERLDGIVRTLITHSSQCLLQETHMRKFLEHIPHTKLFNFLTNEVKEARRHLPTYLNAWEPLFDTSTVPIIKQLAEKPDITFIWRILSNSREIFIDSCLDYSARHVTCEILGYFQPLLTEYFIPRDGRLKMQGAVFYNDFQGFQHLERQQAADEVEAITESLRRVGVDISVTRKGWSSYQLLSELSDFCKKIHQRCSLLVVCVMSHGRSGVLFGCPTPDTSNRNTSKLHDACKINDILGIIGENIPSHIPKVCNTRV